MTPQTYQEAFNQHREGVRELLDKVDKERGWLWLDEYYRTYPDLRTILTCVGCGRQGTSLAYAQGNVSEPLMDNGVQLLDKQGNPRSVDRFVWICRHCGGNKQTRTER